MADLRSRRGWTLDDLAAESGVGRSAIHAIEKRDSRTSAHAPKLARAFGITVDQLLGDEVPTATPVKAAKSRAEHPEEFQAIDDLRDLEKLDPDTRAKILSDLHNAADRARSIARRAKEHDKPREAVAQRRGGGRRSELTIRVGDGNPHQRMLPFIQCDDPFSAEPSERELLLYNRIERNKEG